MKILEEESYWWHRDREKDKHTDRYRTNFNTTSLHCWAAYRYKTQLQCESSAITRSYKFATIFLNFLTQVIVSCIIL